MNTPYDFLQRTPRVTVSIGWQRHAPVHACVFSMHAVSCTQEQLAEVLNPDATVKRGRRTELRYEPAARRALRDSHYTIYTDLMDVGRHGHPLIHHPAHPLHERAARVVNHL